MTTEESSSEFPPPFERELDPARPEDDPLDSATTVVVASEETSLSPPRCEGKARLPPPVEESILSPRKAILY